jgi:rhodanese-related sulfurtransferase
MPETAPRPSPLPPSPSPPRTSPVWRALTTCLAALGLVLGASALGLAVNALRPSGSVPLIAPFPFEQDCPDKSLGVSAPVVKPAQALALVGRAGVVFVDARPREAYDEGHLPGAASIPYSFVTPVDAVAAAPLLKAVLVVVYCDSPGDKLAGMLIEQLREAGLKDPKLLEGGLPAFLEAKHRTGAGGAR